MSTPATHSLEEYFELLGRQVEQTNTFEQYQRLRDTMRTRWFNNLMPNQWLLYWYVELQCCALEMETTSIASATAVTFRESERTCPNNRAFSSSDIPDIWGTVYKRTWLYNIDLEVAPFSDAFPTNTMPISTESNCLAHLPTTLFRTDRLRTLGWSVRYNGLTLRFEIIQSPVTSPTAHVQ
ncbi:hypothetical protein IWQ62_002564 [Dispira parvispora]|uniref:Uncharacterized protein n=1 Tax=Dispira parvispora TaxID=1520584 RepID=A0A9W8E3Q5_9FUNG|nr:hypothetical protein IWQ62_002564 [Dispira parvispora]